LAFPNFFLCSFPFLFFGDSFGFGGGDFFRRRHVCRDTTIPNLQNSAIEIRCADLHGKKI
jgi:hypothetical protein